MRDCPLCTFAMVLTDGYCANCRQCTLAPVVPPVPETLNLFPEVTWDRWAGDLSSGASFFGWVPREDGLSDYVLVIMDTDGPWLISTSSARYSAEFSARLGFHNHANCKRIEHDFPTVKAVRLKASNGN